MGWEKKSSNTFYIAFDRTSQQSCGKGGPWRMPYSVLKFVARLSFWPLSLHLAIVHVCIAQANNLSLPLPPLPWPCLCSLHALGNSNNQFFCGVSACSERKWKDPYQTVGHLGQDVWTSVYRKENIPSTLSNSHSQPQDGAPLQPHQWKHKASKATCSFPPTWPSLYPHK